METALTNPSHPRRHRQHRDHRCPRPLSLALRDRDRWILEALAKMRFLTSSLLARLFFDGSRSAANKRLRRLFDAGLVRTWVRDLAKDNVYALTPAGRDALDDSFDPVATALPCPRRLDGQLDHLLGINAVRIAFAVSHPDATIAWWQSDWELRRFARSETVPDARFALDWPDTGEHVCALEVEYHTRAPRSFLRKILRYAEARSRPFGSSSDDTILVVGRHPAWLERYRQAVASLALGRDVWFTTLSELEQHGASGVIWRPAIGEDCLSLHGLTNRPYGRAGLRTENAAPLPPSMAHAAHTYPSESPHN
jgi:DNA-binding transcriptional ArsR family regulator